MGLPGISKEQMIEVDRIMEEDYQVPIELMMENVGLSLARLAIQLKPKSKFIVVAGSGNNGGGGIVAARRLHGWGLPVFINLPQGINDLRPIPRRQFERSQSMGMTVIEGVMNSIEKEHTILDAYLGYGFTKRDDPFSDSVFGMIREHSSVISLDVPSGLDVNTGESSSGLNPLATLTIAFMKRGLLRVSPDLIGSLFVCDIGVPSSVYNNRLGIEWENPFRKSALDELNEVFASDSIQSVDRRFHEESGMHYWKTKEY